MGRVAFRQALRSLKGPICPIEPELITHVRAKLQLQESQFDKDYFASGALEPFDDRGNNYLHLVATAGYLEYAQFFIDIGCYVDGQNNGGETPLLLAMEAIKYQYGAATLVCWCPSCRSNSSRTLAFTLPWIVLG